MVSEKVSAVFAAQAAAAAAWVRGKGAEMVATAALAPESEPSGQITADCREPNGSTVSSRTCADYYTAGASDPRRSSEPHGPSFCSAWEAYGSDPHVGTETLSYRAISSMHPAP
jgi:hypothetical protein